MSEMKQAAPQATSEPLLLTEERGGIRILRLNRPRQFNAFNMDLLDQLHRQLDELATNRRVRVIVITGTGHAFCAGCDLKQMRTQYTEEFVGALFGSCNAMMQKLLRMPQPVIAAVNGLTTAAGCELVAACDLAVATQGSRFAVSGVNVGLFCSTPAVPLSRNIGRKRAMEMLLTGDFIDADTALDWGLVNRVTADEQLMDTVEDLAQTLISKPFKTLELGKALFYRQAERPFAAAYEDATRTIVANMLDPVAAEGVDAFIQKRSPNWEKP